MKVLVTGVKGQLGFDVVNELEKRGHTAIGVDVDTMDITNSEQVENVIKQICRRLLFIVQPTQQ